MKNDNTEDKALNKTDVMQSVINKKCYPVCSKKHIKKGKCICLTNK